MIRQWITKIRQVFFSSVIDSLITIFWGSLLVWMLFKLSSWVVFNSVVSGTPEDCRQASGACWLFIRENFQNLMYGTYPRQSLWRAQLVYGFIYLHSLLILLPLGRFRAYALISAYTVLPSLIYFVLYGGWGGLQTVTPLYWGGLLLNLSLFMLVIIFMMPVGVLLALARRSQLPLFRGLSRGVVDFFRGVPMVTLLFFATVILPFFLPKGVVLDKYLRVVLVLFVFVGSYAAEVVRGGIQSIPRGQFEAAQALGLGYWQSMATVVLPQAIQVGFPGFVNLAVGILKDTTLVLTVGMMDFLSIMLNVNNNVDWLPYFIEGACFVAAVFWVHCFILSMAGQYWERQIKIGR